MDSPGATITPASARISPTARQRYVLAAARLIDQSGYQSLTARILAHDLGVAPSALYAHFSDMDQLIDAVAAEFIHRLTDDLAAAGTPADTAAARQLLIDYLEWFSRHPHRVELLFLRRRSTPADYGSVRNSLLGMLRTLDPAGRLPVDQLEQLGTVLVWAIHGRLLLGRAFPEELPTEAIGADVELISRTLLPTGTSPNAEPVE